MRTFALPNKPPALSLLLLEGRAFGEFGALLGASPLLRLAPKGDGHSVLVLPGLAANDLSTLALRRFLRGRGYRVYGWAQGLNRGPVPGMSERLRERLAHIRKKNGGAKVSVIGWSLGGIYARELAKALPDEIRQVITLCSPFAGNHLTSNATRTYERLSGRKAHAVPDERDLAAPPPVPSTAIFSRSDGIVAWQSCLEPVSASTENIEVHASHCGMGHHPLALYLIAERLAQGEGRWMPFDRSRGPFARWLLPDPLRA